MLSSIRKRVLHSVTLPPRRELGLLFAGLLGAITVGTLVGLTSPFVVASALIALCVAWVFARSIKSMFLAVVCATLLLPFGTLPFDVGVTPTFLELSSLSLYAMIVVRSLVHADQPFRWSVLTPALVVLLGLSLFSFLIGSNGRPDSLTAHNYFKFLLGVLAFWAVLQVARSLEDIRWMLQILIIVGTAAAALGILLWAMPDPMALRLLVSLAPFGYPQSGRVLRYVEDNPFGVERAIGTSVDPNSFGGMLAVIGALTLTQALARDPVIGRKKAWFAVSLVAGCIFLTQSRAALGGFVLASLFLAAVRYRYLWPMFLALGFSGSIVIAGLGKGASFVERIVEGVQFQDQANLMRLAEFQNALAIIREYPFFGVGFGSAPAIDLTTGVSSVYLTIASRMGLIGLAAFCLVFVIFFMLTTRSIRTAPRAIDEPLLSIQAALVAVLSSGVLDHYFFNIDFSHMVTLLWIVVGLGMALHSLAVAQSTSATTPHRSLSIRTQIAR